MDEGKRQAFAQLAHMAAHVDEYEFEDIVTRFGETVGFGRMMQIVSYSWLAWMQEQGHPEVAVLIPGGQFRFSQLEIERWWQGYYNDPVFGSFEPRSVREANYSKKDEN